MRAGRKHCIHALMRPPPPLGLDHSFWCDLVVVCADRRVAARSRRGSVRVFRVESSRERYVEVNGRALLRLAEIGPRLLSRGRPLALSGGWTASAVLAHLAFWDRFVVARWDQYERTGAIDPLPETLLDLVNAAAMPVWLAMDAAAAAASATQAAAQVADRIAAVDPGAIDYARRTHRLAMLDRSLHWSPHLDELEAALDAG
jgi:hypothetical protein